MLNAANWNARLNELASGANVPGAALGIWSGGQEILAAHGVLNSATNLPVTTDSVFQIGSITKIWTATMIMQLIDEGLLSLDTTISEVLPGARLGAADVGGQVTVRHLLTHTSGIDGHDGDTIGQSAYLRIDPEAGIAACLLTNSAESETLYREVFNEVFGDLAGVTMPAPPRPAGASGSGGVAGLERYAGRYERLSRRFDVSVRDGQMRMVLTMTGNLADLTGSEPEDLPLHPAEPADPAGSPGTRFVLRSRDDEPWVPLSFGELADGTPYIYLSGRVTPSVG